MSLSPSLGPYRYHCVMYCEPWPNRVISRPIKLPTSTSSGGSQIMPLTKQLRCSDGLSPLLIWRHYVKQGQADRLVSECLPTDWDLGSVLDQLLLLHRLRLLAKMIDCAQTHWHIDMNLALLSNARNLKWRPRRNELEQHPTAACRVLPFSSDCYRNDAFEGKGNPGTFHTHSPSPSHSHAAPSGKGKAGEDCRPARAGGIGMREN